MSLHGLFFVVMGIQALALVHESRMGSWELGLSPKGGWEP